MNTFDMFVQLLGLLAWLVLLLSYYRKDTNRILIFQIIATVLYCMHYFLLGAYSGLFICMVEVMCDFLYFKTDKDDYIYMVSIPFRIFGGVLSYQIFVDILPIAASLIDGYSLTKKKDKVVFGAIISYTLWVIYDIGVGSWSCAITDGLVVVSNLSIILFSKHIFKNIDSKQNITKNRWFRTLTNMMLK